MDMELKNIHVLRSNLLDLVGLKLTGSQNV